MRTSSGVYRVSSAARRRPSFTRAIELKPDDVEAYAARGWANLVEQHCGDATADFGHVLRLAPGQREALRGRAWALIQRSAAVVTTGHGALDRAVALDPSDVDARMMRGTAYFSPSFNVRAEAALADFSEAIQLEPGDAEAYFRRALVYATDNPSLGLAIADCRKALSLVPGDRPLRTTLDKLEADERAWQAEQRRVAEAKVLRAEALERAREEVAAGILGFLAVAVMSGGGRPLSAEEERLQQRQWVNDWYNEALMSVGR